MNSLLGLEYLSVGGFTTLSAIHGEKGIKGNGKL